MKPANFLGPLIFMIEIVLPFVVGLVLVAALVLVSVRFARHKATYRFTDRDLQAARTDATKRSQHVLDGKAMEHLTPLIPQFCDRFNPSDAQFLGSPIDYVVFDGLREGDLRRIMFLEIKTGSSSLSRNERAVRKAVHEGRVGFDVLNPTRPVVDRSNAVPVGRIRPIDPPNRQPRLDC